MIPRELRTELSNRHLRYNAPLGEERARVFIERLARPGAEALDLGCGTGALLREVVAASDGGAGYGVDTNEQAIAMAIEALASDAAGGDVTFVCGDVLSCDRSRTGDVVLCVGARHIWPDLGAAFSALRRFTRPSGRVLFGDGLWASPPSDALRAMLGELPTLDEMRTAAEKAGFRVDHDERSSPDEWDEFEGRWRRGFEESELPEARAFALERRREYEQGYRGVLGFAWLTLAG